MPDFKLISIAVDAGDPERYIAVDTAGQVWRGQVQTEPGRIDLHLLGAD